MFSDTEKANPRNILKLPPLAVAAAVTSVGRVALAQTPVTAAVQAMFNVRTYGAHGDGKTLDTPAVNRAIQAVALAGVGTLVFPAGTYVCSPFGSGVI